ncbi:MAG TPA: patatin-like phospholipase family protein [bacterium]|nr:patatin-like phospholipase family protein [bacterium]
MTRLCVVAACVLALAGTSACSLWSHWNDPERRDYQHRKVGQLDPRVVASSAYMADFRVPWWLDADCRAAFSPAADPAGYRAFTEEAYRTVVERQAVFDAGTGRPPPRTTPWRDGLCVTAGPAPVRPDANLIGLALSGGGSRAAVFSTAVMFELQRVHLLRQVDVMSSVSGGSLASAYYAVSCDSAKLETEGACPPTVESPPLWGQPRPPWSEAAVFDRMGRNYLWRWFGSWFLPWNFPRYWFTSFDRTDIMAKVLTDNLYDQSVGGYQGLRFEDLNPQRPYLLINATNNTHPRPGGMGPVGTPGSPDGARCGVQPAGDARARDAAKHFAFTDDMFGCLHSNLDEMELGRAVMASAAFPGVFNYTTLGRYRPRAEDRGDAAEYVHLMDAGVFDNLGLTALERVFDHEGRSDPSANSSLPKRPALRVVILVDAYTTALEAPAAEPDPRTALDHIFDTSALAATDVMMGIRRYQLVRELRERLHLPASAERPGEPPCYCAQDEHATPPWPGEVLHLQFSDLARLIPKETVPDYDAKYVDPLNPTPPRPFDPALLRLVNAMPELNFQGYPYEGERGRRRLAADRESGQLYNRLYDRIAGIGTSFQISGNAVNCLRQAAHILVRLQLIDLATRPELSRLGTLVDGPILERLRAAYRQASGPGAVGEALHLPGDPALLPPCQLEEPPLVRTPGDG